jgi:3-deoxy-manno-octulosonate cytidylyltransferase (CMP-KDO synthetase)
MTKVLGIIPARYASSRFPGKPLIDLKGKSMIQRVYEGVLKSDAFYKVVVATDDERIYKHIQSFGGEVVMTSSDHPSGTDRCGEVLAHYPEADIVVNIQGDEPLVDVRQLELLIGLFQKDEVEIGTLGTYSISAADLGDPNRIKVVVNHVMDALYFSRSTIPFKRNSSDYKYIRHIGLYAFKAATLRELIALKPTELEHVESLEQLRWMYYGYKIRLAITTIETPNIDVPEDVQKVLDVL